VVARSATLNPLVLYDVIPLELCEDLMAEFRHETRRPLSVPRAQGGARAANPTARVCDCGTVSRRRAQKLDDLVGHALVRAWRVATDRSSDQPLMVCRYGPGDQCPPYRDEVTAQDLARARRTRQPVVRWDITVVVFLNAAPQYRGGSVVVGSPPVSIEPTVGGLAAFPLRVRYGVRTVTAGERFTLLIRRDLRTATRPAMRPQGCSSQPPPPPRSEVSRA
jgi:predicted 2-oxoglutarate/Fe(II)-dependent dioxygenase YbiX